ncbi:vesicular glutamate transporter 2-like [Schistocerca cancellata]|uniref:vesicular glutamate transporter 2-like n=1 Tax=Schistocerca cancellata TaxID=274614 RepID=UPI002118958F|nr:vesicular glutamate transporter 2-like [Schistocerca cancellata]
MSSYKVSAVAAKEKAKAEAADAEAAGDVCADGRGPVWKVWRRRRYVVALLAFLGFFNVYALRVNLSVAIVAMTAYRNVTLDNGTVTQVRDFDWDSETQGAVLSSFFLGYLLTQVLGGWLAARVGGQRVYCIGIATTALLTLVTPPLASASLYLLIAVRVVEGLFEGVTYPCIHAVWARWAPPLERSRMATLAFSGSYVGTVVSMPVCGLLAKEVGWQSIFYVFGVVGLVWCTAWWLVVAEGPEKDPRISPEELKYIQDSLGPDSDHKKVVHPWGKFLTSMPVWSIVMAHFCENWGFYTLLTQLPTFMKDAMHFNLKEAGFMSALPYLVMAIILQFSGHLADWLMRRQILSTTMVRKVFNCGAFVAQTVFMLAATNVLTPVGSTVFLTLAVGLGAFAWSGFSVNHLDIAPQHASVLMGLSNTVATLPGIVSPIITGYIVTDKSVERWKYVFYIASAIYLTGAIFYGLFASGERQPWALESPAQDEERPKDDAKGGHVNPALELNEAL